MELNLTFSKYVEKQKSYFTQRTQLRKREQEYLNILEKITFEKNGIQVFSGSHNEVEAKYKTFRNIMEKNALKRTEVPIIGCVYSVASFLILRFTDKLLIGLFLEAKETAIMANAQSFIFWNSVFYIPLAVLIIYRYTIQGLGYSGLAMFAGVAEMVARAMVGFWFVPLWGYFAACIANPVAWLFACFFLIPAYFAVRKRLTKELAAARVED